MVNGIIQGYLAGEALPFPIYDCHAHAGKYMQFPILEGDGEGMVRAMDAGGMKGCILTSLESTIKDAEAGNREVLEIVQRWPDRFLGYVTVNPHYPDVMKRELDKYARAPEFVGAKVHQDVCRCPADDDRWEPLYERANALGWLVLSHVWGRQQVERCVKLLERHRNLHLIVGHAGADYDGYRAAIELADRFENCSLDLTLSMTRAGVVEWLVAEVGPDRVLYGTDMPFFDGRGAPAWPLFADISDKAKEKILGGNLIRLLGERASPWLDGR